mmetsp:Transcript_25937/g.60603  ORF Transcript_25937/g.60603 Transcript_25937/m.60603 type:complete len:200 (+) Transcript_25937:262-861(+)
MARYHRRSWRVSSTLPQRALMRLLKAWQEIPVQCSPAMRRPRERFRVRIGCQRHCRLCRHWVLSAAFISNCDPAQQRRNDLSLSAASARSMKIRRGALEAFGMRWQRVGGRSGAHSHPLAMEMQVLLLTMRRSQGRRATVKPAPAIQSQTRSTTESYWIATKGCYPSCRTALTMCSYPSSVGQRFLDGMGTKAAKWRAR